MISGSCAAGICSSGELILWDTKTASVLAQIQAHEGWPLAIAFSPDGQSALSGSDEGLIHWTIDGDALNLKALLTGHTRPVLDLAFGPAGDTAVSASGDETLILWDLRTGNDIRSFEGHGVAVRAVRGQPGRSIDRLRRERWDSHAVGFAVRRSTATV